MNSDLEIYYLAMCSSPIHFHCAVFASATFRPLQHREQSLSPAVRELDACKLGEHLLAYSRGVTAYCKCVKSKCIETIKCLLLAK